jgi:tryptophanyl-tRNA synthetase
MQPSGRFHLGNYMGALKNWVDLQYDYECYYAIADIHALTSSYGDTGEIKGNIFHMAVDWLSAGLDPEKNVIFVQSHVKEHAELHLYLSMNTPLSWLERVPTYKDKLQQLGAQGKDINTYGFLGYPVLMTADIILYMADFVPVGEDQIPHVELTREMARRFNYLYAPIFPEPRVLLTEAKILPGIDGRKMSKSYGNYISLGADVEELTEKVRQMVTDPARVRKTDKGHPEVCVVYAFHKHFSAAEYGAIGEDCRRAAVGCVACKKRLTARMMEALSPIREKREDLLRNPSYIEAVLEQGARRARREAEKNINKVREAMRL